MINFSTLKVLFNFYLLVLLFLWSISTSAQPCKGNVNRVLDFTILQNGSVSAVLEGKLDDNKLHGIYTSYKNGHQLFEKRYNFSINEYSSLDSLEKYSCREDELFQAYALPMAKNNTLFYGHLKGRDNEPLVFIFDKNGRMKKQFSRSIDVGLFRQENPESSFRSYAFFWLIAQKNYLRISQYFNFKKKAVNLTYRSPIMNGDEVEFDNLSFRSSGEETVISHSLKGEVIWTQNLDGILDFRQNSQDFKVIETKESYFFFLYQSAIDPCKKEDLIPILFEVKKNGQVLQHVQLHRQRA